MKNIKFHNQLIAILITFILILGCESESESELEPYICCVLPPNLCPIGQPDNYTVKAGKSIEIDFYKGVLSNDKDPPSKVLKAKKGRNSFK